ncbi:hypothetical protein ATCC90586_012245 [Pythium insidiosum]|nr:hypothetical protein ATCC90586_012245 [Pythium insidiosum]
MERARADFAAEAVDGALPPFVPRAHGHSVTVPGAVAGWVDALNKWGSMRLADVLAPAIELARDGFPVSPITAHGWARGKHQLDRSPHGHELLLNGTRAPEAGEIFRNPTLAASLEVIAAQGKAGFYTGRVAEAIVEAVAHHGGVLALEDLAAHTSTVVTPIKTTASSRCWR